MDAHKKKKTKKTKRTCQFLLPTYVEEFVWRQDFGDKPLKKFVCQFQNRTTNNSIEKNINIQDYVQITEEGEEDWFK